VYAAMTRLLGSPEPEGTDELEACGAVGVDDDGSTTFRSLPPLHAPVNVKARVKPQAAKGRSGIRLTVKIETPRGFGSTRDKSPRSECCVS
jgi:hypothetical protein